jgi:hypothetical protein
MPDLPKLQEIAHSLFERVFMAKEPIKLLDEIVFFTVYATFAEIETNRFG